MIAEWRWWSSVPGFLFSSTRTCWPRAPNGRCGIAALGPVSRLPALSSGGRAVTAHSGWAAPGRAGFGGALLRSQPPSARWSRCRSRSSPPAPPSSSMTRSRRRWRRPRRRRWSAFGVLPPRDAAPLVATLLPECVRRRPRAAVPFYLARQRGGRFKACREWHPNGRVMRPDPAPERCCRPDAQRQGLGTRVIRGVSSTR